ncbi:MAG: cobalt transporter CbiM [Beijerinckiaceae bacterium]|nr:cobalt transporter CbiM [Beijerinckiaceae bacterium]MDO9440759.1 cobalt transporter CbiM [Beijerinckiaceae bacterium]
MAHIPDGVLSAPVLMAGGVLAAGGIAYALRRLDEQDIPRTAILSAAFFAVSLFALPVGPSSVHLLLGGLMGLILGVAIFPAVFIALLLQSVMFGFGGLTSLGVNTFNIALPGAVIGVALAPAIARSTAGRAALLAGTGSALAVGATGALVALSLALSSTDYVASAKVMIATYVPLMCVEGLVAGFCVSFVKKVKPELLSPAPAGA